MPPRRLARFAGPSGPFFAEVLEDGRVRPVSDPFAPVVPMTPADPIPSAGLVLLPPSVPSAIVGIGRNYRAHAAELGHALPAEPLIFLKAVSSLLPSGGVIRLPGRSRRVDFEGELGVVIGTEARRVPVGRALEHVFGWTCVNDVTARDLQVEDVQFTRAKSFDTFCPCGPWIVCGPPPPGLVLETRVNGKARQSAPIADMIFDVATLVSFVSGVMTLRPGDLIATGTPAGVGPLAAGDEVEIVLGDALRLVNGVAAEPGEDS